MIASRLPFVLVLCSMLSTPALAVEPFTPEQEQAKLLQLQQGKESQGGDMGTQVVKEISPQREESFPTYWFVRTHWKVENPHGTAVQVHVTCDKYGYNFWYRIPPNDKVEGHWGCEGAALRIFNNAPQGSSLFVTGSTW
jgi:hypothetical protein